MVELPPHPQNHHRFVVYKHIIVVYDVRLVNFEESLWRKITTVY